MGVISHLFGLSKRGVRMKKMGKWLLSVLVAVSLTMPVLADANVQSTGAESTYGVQAADESSEAVFATESESVMEAESGTETESESQTESTSETESESQTESETEEETEDPVDVKLDDYLNTSVVLKKAACTGFGKVEVQWQPFSMMDVEGYRVYRRTEDSKWKRLADVAGTLTSYTDTTAQNGQKYYYTVRAKQTFENIEYLSQYDKNGVSCTAMPKAPVIYSELTGSNSAKLTWTAVNGAELYRIYIKDDATGKWKRTAQVTGKSYQLKNLVCGKKYSYTVRAFKKVNGKETASAYNGKGLEIQTVPDTPVLNKPSLNKADGSVKVSWKEAAGATEYRVYRKNNAKDAFKLIGTTKSTSYADKTAQIGQKYIYTVKATAISGKDRSYSDFDHQGISTTVKLGTPSLKKISTSSYKSITVGWNAVARADGYRVYRKEVGGTWKRIAQVKGGQKESYTDKTAQSAKVYIYTVRAYCESDGTVYLSNYDQTGTYWIDTPKMKTAVAYGEVCEAKHNQIRYDIMVGWEEVEGADGYYVYRKVGSGKWKKVKEYKAADSVGDLFIDMDLEKGTTYSYTVRAYCNVNGKIVLGGYDPKGSTATAKVR